MRYFELRINQPPDARANLLPIHTVETGFFPSPSSNRPCKPARTNPFGRICNSPVLSISISNALFRIKNQPATRRSGEFAAYPHCRDGFLPVSLQQPLRQTRSTNPFDKPVRANLQFARPEYQHFQCAILN